MPAVMHADQIDVPAELVRRLLEEQFPQLAALPLEEVDSTGTVNALFRLGPDLLVRLPLTPHGDEGVRHEHAWLPWFAGRLPVRVPVLRGAGEPSLGYPCPWSVLEWIGGSVPDAEDLTDPDGLAVDLGELVTAIRRLDPAGAPPAYRGEPVRTADADVRVALAEIAADPVLRQEIDVPAVSAAWDEVLAVPDWSAEPVWVHSDLLPGNLLVADGRLVGLLDLAASGLGDPACDAMIAWSLLPANGREVFRTAAGFDDATWARGRGWALSGGLGGVRYYRRTNPAMAALARRQLRAVLADHEAASH
jgi:aminoglycoside phosphotransferase (APT) family kinase protein